MANDSERFIKKGRGEPREGLVQQGLVHLKLFATHKAALEKRGFKQVKADGLKTRVEQLQAATAVQADAKGASKGKTVAEHKAVTDAKALVRDVRIAALPALRDAPVEGVTVESFNSGKPLGRETAAVSAYLTKIGPALKKADASFKPYFDGESLWVKADELRKKLDDANAEQEVAVGALPADTKDVYEAKGRVLEFIEDMNRAGKLAFPGDAVTAAQFNKDVLLRARKEMKAEKVPT